MQLETLDIIPAQLEDHPLIQNMARFYVYDLSRYCGLELKEWGCPENGLYESFNFKEYFNSPTKEAFLIRVNGEPAGFALLNQEGTDPVTNWNMGEFFILARFQNKGIATRVAQEIWQKHPGQWEVAIIPENLPALAFWRKAVAQFTQEYTEVIKHDVTYDYDPREHTRYIMSFRS